MIDSKVDAAVAAAAHSALVHSLWLPPKVLPDRMLTVDVAGDRLVGCAAAFVAARSTSGHDCRCETPDYCLPALEMEL